MRLLSGGRRGSAPSRPLGRPVAWAVLARLLPLAPLTLAVGCGAQLPLPPQPKRVSVTMREYSFAFDRAIPRGPLVFTVVDDGTFDHELVLVRLPPDFRGTLDQQLHGSVRRPVATLAFIGPLHHGESGTFAVDLSPGKYGVLSFVRSSDGVADALKGMDAEFTVT